MAVPKKNSIPDKVQPMLATLTKDVFQDPEWVYEVKWDGYRVVAYVENGKVVLHSREGQNYTQRYPEVVGGLSKLKGNAVLDGEVVYLNEEGRPDFNKLISGEPGHLVYYAFDLVWLNGQSLTELSLLERKKKLRSIFKDSNHLKYSEHFKDGKALFEYMQQLNMEGVVAKRKDSNYQLGKRVNSWRKIKINQRREYVIAGWTESEKGNVFKSILFGHYEEGKLKYVHHGGGGFKEKERKEVFRLLKEREVKKSPFANPQDVNVETKIHWTKPDLVAEFEISNVTTTNGFIRHPAIFLGLRSDKKPIDVTTEEPVQAAPVIQKPRRQQPTSQDSNWPVIEKQEITSKEVFDIDNRQLALINVEKELWKNVTKADLIRYYHAVAPYILPHLRDRPLSLHIKHISPNASGLYIKDMEGRQPDWAETFTVNRKHRKAGKRDQIDYLVCQDLATLLYVVNLGCIDINPWTARTSNYLEPDFIIIDLDPSDDNFSKVIKTAEAAKHYFDKLKLKAFVKTSGKSGMHLFLPCEGFTFPQARSIAEDICTAIHKLVPDITTTAVSINQRGNKLYIDPNQNDEADTIAAAYSVRPYKLPTVSTPLEWKEVKADLNPSQFTIQNILKRVQTKGDLFRGVHDKKTAKLNSKILKSVFL